jgi:hypothetical protein
MKSPTPNRRVGLRSRLARLERLAAASSLIALVGCDRIAIALNPPLLPSAKARVAELRLPPGEARSIEVDVCPPQHYTTDLGYISVAADVNLGVGTLPRGVQARWETNRIAGSDFGPNALCHETLLHLSAAADADLAAAQTIELRASSPFNDNQAYATTLRLLPAAAPPPALGCEAVAARRWQALGDGLLPATPDLELGGVQLARSGERVFAAWWEREHLPERFFVRLRQHGGSGWAALGDVAANAGDDSHVEHLQLWHASPPATPAAADGEDWLGYASSSGFGLGHPAQLVLRRRGTDDRFERAVPPLAIGSPYTLQVIRGRHGLLAATVARGDSELRLWRIDPDAASPGWARVPLAPTLADTTVRKVALAIDTDGSVLMALNRIDREAGQVVERLQLWRVGSDADPAAMSAAAPDHEIRRYVSFGGFATGAHTLLLLRDPAAPPAQATALAWFTGESVDAFGLIGRADGSGPWVPIGDLAGFTRVEQIGSLVQSPSLVAGCDRQALLSWADAQAYPNYSIRSLQANPAAAQGFSRLGGAAVQGDVGRYSATDAALLWNGVGGDPMALVLRLDLQTRRQELAVRTLWP